MILRKMLFLLGLALVLVVTLYRAAELERAALAGREVLLELEPLQRVRTSMRGEYMDVQYVVERHLRHAADRKGPLRAGETHGRHAQNRTSGEGVAAADDHAGVDDNAGTDGNAGTEGSVGADDSATKKENVAKDDKNATHDTVTGNDSGVGGEWGPGEPQCSGRMALMVDGDGVARFSRLLLPDEPAADDEILLVFPRCGEAANIAMRRYFFHDVGVQRSEQARFGVLRVDEKGEAVLTDVLDQSREPLSGKASE